MINQIDNPFIETTEVFNKEVEKHIQDHHDYEKNYEDCRVCASQMKLDVDYSGADDTSCQE